MHLLFELPRRLLESNAILTLRLLLGDERTAALGNRWLTEDTMLGLARRHSRQMASVVQAGSG